MLELRVLFLCLLYLRVVNSSVPPLIYGTAWKNEKTQSLVTFALKNVGYLGIDTANQKKHYNEEGVGNALQDYYPKGRRPSVFIQTKFTPLSDQFDLPTPYSITSSVFDQVLQSVLNPRNGSLFHLYGNSMVDDKDLKVDSLLLHAPNQNDIINQADIEAWRGMERLYDEGYVKMLGLSNVTPKQIRKMYSIARIKPTFIQNRCHCGKGTRWEKSLRDVTNELGMKLQCFGIISLNRQVLHHETILNIAKVREYRYTPSQIVFNFFSFGLNVIVVSGSESFEQIQQTYQAIYDFHPPLTNEEIAEIIAIGEEVDLTAEKIKLSIFNNFNDKSIRLFWLGHSHKDKIDNGEILPGEKITIETFHFHRFSFETDEEIVSSITIDGNLGFDQTIQIPSFNNEEL